MQVTETNADGLKHEFTVVVAAADIEQQIKDRLTEIGRSVRLPGFRPGKAPIAVLKKRYGPSVHGRGGGARGQRQLHRRHPRAQSAPGAAAQDRDRLVQRGQGPRIQAGGRGAARNRAASISPRSSSNAGSPKSRTRRSTRRWSASPSSSARARRWSAPAKNGDIVVIDFKGTVDGWPFPAAAPRTTCSNWAPAASSPASRTSSSAPRRARRAASRSHSRPITATPSWPARRPNSPSPSTRCAKWCRRRSTNRWPRRSAWKIWRSCARPCASGSSANTPRYPGAS